MAEVGGPFNGLEFFPLITRYNNAFTALEGGGTAFAFVDFDKGMNVVAEHFRLAAENVVTHRRERQEYNDEVAKFNEGLPFDQTRIPTIIPQELFDLETQARDIQDKLDQMVELARQATPAPAEGEPATVNQGLLNYLQIWITGYQQIAYPHLLHADLKEPYTLFETGPGIASRMKADLDEHAAAYGVDASTHVTAMAVINGETAEDDEDGEEATESTEGE
ncbi:MAG: hypothetical protein J4F41_00005 [Alphaproteobacteria bacterium]|nr:hypothetical protein [Alphaproteobacteria bacterium]